MYLMDILMIKILMIVLIVFPVMILFIAVMNIFTFFLDYRFRHSKRKLKRQLNIILKEIKLSH